MRNHIRFPGCYGKLPGLGDFLSRRLDPTFVAVWDRWLQAGLQDSRAHLGQQWAECYLHAPIWRFALAPGLCGERAMLGILMPSVDSVGRYFPFSIIQEAGAMWPAAWAVAEAGGWFDRVERVALAGLNDNLGPEQMDTLLADCLLPSLPASTAGNGFHVAANAERMARDSGQSASGTVLEYLLLSGSPVVERSLERQGIWWQSHSGGARSIRRCAYLGPDLFTSLLKREGS